jgi:hypothetical protein
VEVEPQSLYVYGSNACNLGLGQRKDKGNYYIEKKRVTVSCSVRQTSCDSLWLAGTTCFLCVNISKGEFSCSSYIVKTA